MAQFDGSQSADTPAFEHPDIPLPESSVLDLLRRMHGFAVGAGPFSSVAKVLHRETARLWPGYTPVYLDDVVDDMLWAQLPFHCPLLSLESPEGIISTATWLRAHLTKMSAREAAYWEELLEHASVISGSVWVLHPYARDLRYLLPNPAEVPEQFLDPRACVFFDEIPWEKHWKSIHCAMLLGWVSIILRPDPLRLPPREEHQSLLNGGLYAYAEAQELAQKLLALAMPFEGPGGKVLAVHGNDPRSFDFIAAARKVIEKPLGEPLLVAIHRECWDSQATFKKALRHAEIFRLKNQGLSHERIAESLIEQGMIKPEWTQERDASESAQRQVRRDVRHLTEDFPEGSREVW